MVFPITYLLPDYEDRQDIPSYFAQLLANYPEGSIQHWPTLVYAESYASFGFGSFVLGLAYGIFYAMLDRLIKIKWLFPFLFPFSMWFYYMTFRGAVANAVCSIPRELYMGAILCGLPVAILQARGPAAE